MEQMVSLTASLQSLNAYSMGYGSTVGIIVCAAARDNQSGIVCPHEIPAFCGKRTRSFENLRAALEGSAPTADVIALCRARQVIQQLVNVSYVDEILWGGPVDPKYTEFAKL